MAMIGRDVKFSTEEQEKPRGCIIILPGPRNDIMKQPLKKELTFDGYVISQ